MDKRTVIIADFNGSIVTYYRIDDCDECQYDTGDKSKDHECCLTGESLHGAGFTYIGVPESCPFPVVGAGVDPLTANVAGRHPGINETNLLEILQQIKKKHSARTGFGNTSICDNLTSGNTGESS